MRTWVAFYTMLNDLLKIVDEILILSISLSYIAVFVSLNIKSTLSLVKFFFIFCQFFRIGESLVFAFEFRLSWIPISVNLNFAWHAYLLVFNWYRMSRLTIFSCTLRDCFFSVRNWEQVSAIFSFSSRVFKTTCPKFAWIFFITFFPYFHCLNTF